MSTGFHPPINSSNPSHPSPSFSFSMTLPSYQCTIRDDRTSQCVAQSCNIAHDTIARSARPFFSVPSPSISMTALPPDRFVRSLLSGVNPGLSVQELEAVPSPRIQLLYNVKVSEGPSLLLALSPPAVMRLLRCEKSSIASEAAVLKWLSGMSGYKGKKTPATQKDPVVVKNPDESLGCQRAVNHLSEYLPILVRHEAMGGGPAVEYNLSRPPHGVAITSLSRSLTCRERRIIDFQTGQLLRRISSQVSPNRRFGIVADVLSVQPSSFQARRFEGGLHSTRGADSWSIAFHAMLESVLRDGEDLAIMISYGAIRRHFDRFGHLLDAVTKPRLVVVDAGEDINTLVFRYSDSGKKVGSPSESINGKRPESKSTRKPSIRPEVNGVPTVDIQNYDDETDSEDEEDYKHLSETQGKGHVDVTGLRQWTNCLFGDPLIASVFHKNPTRAFWGGFDRAIPGADDTEPLAASIIEDEPNAHIRLLLYECYHAIVAVVREYYRPQTDSNKRELAARKQLSTVLAQLEQLDDLGAPRRRRPSGEVSPAKRPRSGGDDCEH